jgi:hypothetical protein
MRPDTIKSAHSKFGMPVFSVKLFGRDSHPKRVTEQYGVLSKTADAIQTFWTDRRRQPGSNGIVHLPPQSITEVRGKPRSAQA